MKKTLISLCLITMAFLPVYAEIQEATLSTDATVNSDIAPDTATIRFTVENSGTNIADIKAKNDKIVNTAINEIKKKLNADETVKTITYRVNSVYSYKEKIRIFQKYEVTNGFEVKLKDINKVSEIINIATSNGVKNVGGLNFSLADGEKACNELMAKSIKIAKTRAEYLANSAGTSLLKIKSINPYCSQNSTYVQPRMMSNALMKSAGAMEDSTVESIEPGTINVRAGVNMTYYLK